jgi:RNA polymerase sigma-70 factor (ECF subfamily)
MTALQHHFVAPCEDRFGDSKPTRDNLPAHAAFSNDQIERLQPIVAAALRRVARTTDPEYEDLMQSALMGVISALGARGFGDEPSPRWVATVARNIAIDELRARVRARRVFMSGVDHTPSPQPVAGVGPEHLSQIRDELRRLDGALRKLCPSRRVVLYLHDMLGYELAEIAQIIGTSVAAAQSRLVRGRRAVVRDMRG